MYQRELGMAADKKVRNRQDGGMVKSIVGVSLVRRDNGKLHVAKSVSRESMIDLTCDPGYGRAESPATIEFMRIVPSITKFYQKQAHVEHLIDARCHARQNGTGFS